MLAILKQVSEGLAACKAGVPLKNWEASTKIFDNGKPYITYDYDIHKKKLPFLPLFHYRTVLGGGRQTCAQWNARDGT